MRQMRGKWGQMGRVGLRGFGVGVGFGLIVGVWFGVCVGDCV